MIHKSAKPRKKKLYRWSIILPGYSLPNSKTPVKNKMAPNSTYDGFSMCVENANVQGAVSNHKYTNQGGIPGILLVIYQPKNTNAAKERLFSKKYGASGVSSNCIGTAINKPCNPPGICVAVYTTSGPK